MSEAGPSIAEIHGLDEHDPWQRPGVEDELEKRKEALQRKIADRWAKDGLIKEAEPFCDPPDDYDPSILEGSSLATVWRLTVYDRRLIDIMTPSIMKVTLAFKNTGRDCWLAFTGKRIAMRFEAALNADGILTRLTMCDIHGKTSGGAKKSDDIYYCIAEYDHGIYAFFIPSSHWDAHESVFEGDLGITDRLKDLMQPTERSYCYRARSSDMLIIKATLDRMEFRENLLFQSFINGL